MTAPLGRPSPAPSPTSGDGVLRPLLVLAIPFAIGSGLHLAAMAVNRAWVGRVGTEALAAVGLAAQTLLVLGVCAMGMAIGTLAGVARSIGAGDRAQAGQFFAQGIHVALMTGIAAAVASIFLPEPLLRWMGADSTVAGPAATYLRLGMVGLLVQAPLFTLAYALQGAGEARASLRLSAVAPLANLVLDPLFIFGFRLGVEGAAYAAVLSNALGLAAGLWLIGAGRTGLHVDRAAFRLRGRVLARIVTVGVPGSLEHMVRMVAGIGLLVILTPFGATVLSAYTSANVILMMLIFPGIALGQATAALVGQNLGAGRPDRAWRTAWASATLYSAFMTFLAAVVWVAGEPLVRIFDDNPEVVEEGRRILRTVVICFPFIGVALTLSRAFGGAGRTLPPMAASAIAHLLLQIPLARFLASSHGPFGAYVAMVAAFMLHGLLSAGLFVRYFRGWRGGGNERAASGLGRGSSVPWQGDRSVDPD